MPQYRVNDQVRYKPVGGMSKPNKKALKRISTNLPGRESNTSESVGIVKKVITEPGSLTGRQVQASQADPRYEVQSILTPVLNG
jgi:hypothetical protein